MFYGLIYTTHPFRIRDLTFNYYWFTNQNHIYNEINPNHENNLPTKTNNSYKLNCSLTNLQKKTIYYPYYLQKTQQIICIYSTTKKEFLTVYNFNIENIQMWYFQMKMITLISNRNVIFTKNYLSFFYKTHLSYAEFYYYCDSLDHQTLPSKFTHIFQIL